jgi:hypothetical protein
MMLTLTVEGADSRLINYLPTPSIPDYRAIVYFETNFDL